MIEQGRQGMGSPHDRTWFLGILALAFVLRLIHVLVMRASPAFEAPIMDALYHVEWAQAFAQGRSFQEGPFFRAPLYPWFLGVILKLFGDGLFVPRLVQAFLGALASGLTFLLARQLFSAWTARLAGLVAATYWVSIYFDGELLIPTLIVPLNLAGLLALVSLARGREPRSVLRSSALGGFFFGLSAIGRPNVLLVMPFLALWLLRIRGLRAVLALTAGTLVPILPITLYNVSAGDPTLISTQGGVNFWIGNNPVSDGSTAIVPGTRGGWWEGYYDAIAQAEQAEGRELSPSEVSQYYFGRAWSWMRSEPGAFLAHLGWKLRLFWMDWELGNNQEVRFFALRYNPVLRWLPVDYALLMGLGLAGMWAAFWREPGRREERLPLALFLVIYAASVVLFFVCSRFRVPVLPLLAIFASHGALWLIARARARDVRAFTVGAILAVGSWSAAHWLPAGVKTSEANGYWQLGIYDLKAGDVRGAEGHLRYATQLDPGNLFARSALARLLLDRGELSAAEGELREAFLLDPERMDTWDVWFELKLRQQAYDEILFTADQLRAERPHLASPYFHVARVFQVQGQESQALEALRAALQRDPAHFAANYLLALLSHDRGPDGRAEAQAALQRIFERSASAPAELLAEAQRLAGEWSRP